MINICFIKKGSKIIFKRTKINKMFIKNKPVKLGNNI